MVGTKEELLVVLAELRRLRAESRAKITHRPTKIWAFGKEALDKAESIVKANWQSW